MRRRGCIPCCGGTGPPPTSCGGCQPCFVPDVDLTLSWINGTLGNGSCTLIYDSSTETWNSGCVANNMKYRYVCYSTGFCTDLIVTSHDATCPASPHNSCSVCFPINGFQLQYQDGYTCVPYHVEYPCILTGCTHLTNMGFTKFIIDGPTPACCEILIHGVDCSGSEITSGFTANIVGLGGCNADRFGKCVTGYPSGLPNNTFLAQSGSLTHTGSSKFFTTGDCPGQTDVSLLLTLGSSSAWTITAIGCNGVGVLGAVVLVAGGSYVTDTSGQISFSANGTSFPYTISYSMTNELPSGIGSATASGTITGTCTGGGSSTATLDYCCQFIDPPVGCNSQPIQAVVNIYDTLGGTLLATSPFINVNLAWVGSCNVYMTVNDGSGTFVPYGQSLSLTQAGTISAGVLTPASGYHCYTGDSSCSYAVTSTMFGLFDNAGVQTFTYSSGAWTASFTYLTIPYVISLLVNGTMTGTASGVGFTCTFTLWDCAEGLFLGDINTSTQSLIIGNATISI